MFFVAGITGHVGGAAARRLLEGGYAVRTLARDPGRASAWARQGVEVFRGDLADAQALASALDGVEGAFLLLPPVLAPAPGFPEANAMISSFRQALEHAPPPRLVALSSVGSERGSGLGLITSTHLLEAALWDRTLPTAFVRAASFLENYALGLGAVAASGWFDTFLSPTHRRVPVVATEDVGAEVARLLQRGWSGRTVVEVGRRVSPDDLARAMGKVLGRPVQARSIAREHWRASLEAQGMKPGTTGPFEEMEDAFNSGWIDFDAPDTQQVCGEVTPAEVFARGLEVARRDAASCT